ncbi:hypothetical protein E5Q_00661 [Mixia osmundae IAM 14324]|uniref:Phosphoribosyltransferase domain-containing protein n=1 Tax=Mixia osmundae (strain CBS 9802 / IAM 14324 / JCM 22182 / KY 12970) TaxID=764103 RepID=G7DTV4_MIXOS|nr:hypothetical protein E5Q_00661 [Mixia osmundae IAM 14324]
MSADDGHVRVTYEEIHLIIGKTAAKIRDEFTPDMMIAIGGGGFFPARVLRSFLKDSKKRNIPIQAIGLSLYEELGALDGSLNGPSTTEEKLGKEVVRTQWLDHSTLGARPLIGRKILIVDEVDDSRTTLGYAVTELQKDVEHQLALLPPERRSAVRPTEFAVFVVHNKLKEKLGSIPGHIKYFSGEDIEDAWVDYPWEQTDIVLHNKLAQEARARTN